ncbi:MAG: leucine-rich repeat protein [Clostridia bacterium]|nr:leucine-rich repeat protein [Clostridia bacterium]
MKTAQRLVTMILVLVLLMANGGITALADAVLTLPTALQIIDERAFYGSTSIGKVVLSNNVTEIRSRAFANSTLYEINLPASITYIAEDAFEGPDKVTITASEGSYAYRWAVEHGYISEEIEVIDFSVSPDMLTLTVGSTYTLSAAFVPSNATTVSITWGSSKKTVATVNNGVVTAKAEGKAIMRMPMLLLKIIGLPPRKESISL